MTTADFSEIDSIDWRRALFGGFNFDRVDITLSQSFLKVATLGKARLLGSGEGIIDLADKGEFRTRRSGKDVEITYVREGGNAHHWGSPPQMKFLQREWCEIDAGGLAVQVCLVSLPFVPRAICVRRTDNTECLVYPSIYKAGTSLLYGVVALPLRLRWIREDRIPLRQYYDSRCILASFVGERQDRSLESRAAILGLAWLITCQPDFLRAGGGS